MSKIKVKPVPYSIVKEKALKVSRISDAYIVEKRNEKLSKLTVETIRKSRQDIDIYYVDNAIDLFEQLDL